MTDEQLAALAEIEARIEEIGYPGPGQRVNPEVLRLQSQRSSILSEEFHRPQGERILLAKLPDAVRLTINECVEGWAVKLTPTIPGPEGYVGPVVHGLAKSFDLEAAISGAYTELLQAQSRMKLKLSQEARDRPRPAAKQSAEDLLSELGL